MGAFAGLLSEVQAGALCPLLLRAASLSSSPLLSPLVLPPLSPLSRKRPFLASECKVLPEAEKWRRQVIGEISRKVAEIQNGEHVGEHWQGRWGHSSTVLSSLSLSPLFPALLLLPPPPAAGLGEARLRDLNDEINKLLREKGHWERQIKALGGPDHAQLAPRMFDAEGKELPGSGGYRYFGAAKELPGVRELFEVHSADRARKTRGELVKGITPDYYGYRDEDNDPSLLVAEAEAERKLIAEGVASFAAHQEALRKARELAAGGKGQLAQEARAALEAVAYALGDAGAAAGVGMGAAGGAAAGGGVGGAAGGGDAEDDLAEEASALSSASFKAHVPVPSQKEIEAMLLEKRKQLLLAKYASSELMAAQQESRKLVADGK